MHSISSMYMSIAMAKFIPPQLPPARCPYVYSLCVCLYFCFENNIIYPIFRGFPGVSDGKELVCHVESLGSIPGSGRSPGGGNDNPLLYSCLENSTDRRAWQATVHGSQRIKTQLSDYHFHFSYHFSRFHIYVLIRDICFSLSDRWMIDIWEGQSSGMQGNLGRGQNPVQTECQGQGETCQ